MVSWYWYVSISDLFKKVHDQIEYLKPIFVPSKSHLGWQLKYFLLCPSRLSMLYLVSIKLFRKETICLITFLLYNLKFKPFIYIKSTFQSITVNTKWNLLMRPENMWSTRQESIKFWFISPEINQTLFYNEC